MPADSLAAILTQRYGLPISHGAQLANRFVPRSFARGQCVMACGARDASLYFVERGVWRIFYRSEDGREHNKAFVHDGMFFFALSSHLEDAPLRFEVQALTDAVAMTVPYVEIERWMETDLEIAALWRRYMQAHFVRHEAREAALQLEDAAGRYRWFLERHPGLVDRIPLYHIASYLGLTSVTLSRVRRALASGS